MHVYAQPETSKTSHATQHIQISIGKQTTMHVNQKSISRQIVKQNVFCKLAHATVVGRLTETDQTQISSTSRACYIHAISNSNIHCQANNHACEPEVNITSNRQTEQAFCASCAHASKNTAQSWAASTKLANTDQRQAVHVYVHSVTPEAQPPFHRIIT